MSLKSRPAPPAPLHTRKQDLVRGAIWDAAIDLFARTGFDETTVDDIAASAGVSTRTFFRYFATKNDLMGQGMVRYRTMLMEAIASAPPECTPLEVLRFASDRVAAEAAASPRIRQVMQIATTNAAAREAQLSRRTQVEDGIAIAFAARSRKRSHDDITPRLFSGLMLAILDVSFRTWAAGSKPMGVVNEDVFRALTTLVRQA